MPNASRTVRIQPACGDMSAWGASRPRCSSRAVRNARGRWDSCRRGPSRKLTLPMIADPGHHVAITFGSKFRAITRAITHGQSGVITVNRGRSRERTPVPVKHKHAGHRPMTCCFSGGQGWGRTADLPIFRTSKGVRGVRPRMDSCSVGGWWVLSCPPGAGLVLANPLAGRTNERTPVDALLVSERGSACRRLWRTRPTRPVPPVRAKRLRAGGPWSVAPRRLRRARPCAGVHV
jgi:hypothetical protein